MFEKIQELKKKHNAIILAHYYQEDEILWRVIIHVVFVFSGLIFALTEKFMHHK